MESHPANISPRAQTPSGGASGGGSVVKPVTVALVICCAVVAAAWWLGESPGILPQQLQVRIGVGLAAGVPLAVLVGGWLFLRQRMRAFGAIRSALRSAAEGQPTSPALSVDPRLGAEAGGWNRVINENDSLRKELALDRARETQRSRRGGNWANAFNAMSQGLILVDERRRIVFSNGAAAMFLKTSRDEIVGKDVVTLVEDEQAREALTGALTEGKLSRVSVVAEHETEGGGFVALRFTSRPVRKEDNAAAVLLIEDITQQRVADRARNSFVAHATHELRTPLTNIRLYVEMAIDDGDDPQIRAKCLNVINEETRRLERMVGELLSVSEMEAGSFRIVRDDVRTMELIDEMRSDFQVQADQKQIELNFDLPPKLPTIQGDMDKLRLAVHNLLGNALKYTPEGGKVTVRAEVNAKQLVLKFSDSGIGIPEGDIAKIFETFYRAQDERLAHITGSGLGLPLARKVIRMHDGEIDVESVLNEGSTFTVTLPLAEEAV